jgi:hypothetical protein
MEIDSQSWDVAKPRLKVSEYAAMGMVPNRAAAADVTVYAEILATVRSMMRLPAVAYAWNACLKNPCGRPKMLNGMDLLSKYSNGIAAAHWLTAVAAPAPPQPMPQPKMRMGSRTMLTRFPNVVHGRTGTPFAPTVPPIAVNVAESCILELGRASPPLVVALM